MFSLSVAFGSGSGIIVWGFMFKTKEKADEAIAKLKAVDSYAMGATGNPNTTISIEDDYGQSGTIGRNHIQGFMLEDMAQTKLAQVERHLHDAKMRMAATSAINSDPGLKFAATQAGPAMLGTGPNGRF